MITGPGLGLTTFRVLTSENGKRNKIHSLGVVKQDSLQSLLALTIVLPVCRNIALMLHCNDFNWSLVQSELPVVEYLPSGHSRFIIFNFLSLCEL